MRDKLNVNRRTVLRTLSAGVAGGAVLVGNATARPRRSYGFIEGDSGIEGGETVTLTEKRDKVTVECVYGEKYSTREWGVEIDGNGVDEKLALLTDGYRKGDELKIAGEPFHDCSDPYEAEVLVELVD